MARNFLLIGSLAALLGVTIGAFGTHALRGRIAPDMLGVFETAVRYQMYHAIAIVLVSALMTRLDGWLIHAAGWSFTIGIVLFSGSLYLLAATGTRILGAITPIGGVFFIVGWACLALAAL